MCVCVWNLSSGDVLICFFENKIFLPTKFLYYLTTKRHLKGFVDYFRKKKRQKKTAKANFRLIGKDDGPSGVSGQVCCRSFCYCARRSIEKNFRKFLNKKKVVIVHSEKKIEIFPFLLCPLFAICTFPLVNWEMDGVLLPNFFTRAHTHFYLSISLYTHTHIQKCIVCVSKCWIAQAQITIQIFPIYWLTNRRMLCKKEI